MLEGVRIINNAVGLVFIKIIAVVLQGFKIIQKLNLSINCVCVYAVVYGGPAKGN